MRVPLLFLAVATCAFSQPFSFGVKAGLPLTDFFNTVSSGNYSYTSITNRYVIGPTAELRLPFGLGVEFDALYRHYSYYTPGFLTNPPYTQTQYGYENAGGGAWEFPLLAKYRFPSKILRPYVDAGVAWDTLSGLSATVCAINCGSTSNPPSLHKDSLTGFVTGVGVDVHLLRLHLSPEIRYTRWSAQHFLSPNGGLSSTQNQAEFLLGITF
ncbi:MAG: PorT family protein [Acidobacteriia bacterium]|nr:PorT family protein [Terriglobia bacterium]